MNGKWEGGNCKCGNTIMTEYSQQCEQGKIKKQEVKSQALKTTNLKLPKVDINSSVSSGLNPLGNNK